MEKFLVWGFLLAEQMGLPGKDEQMFPLLFLIISELLFLTVGSADVFVIPVHAICLYTPFLRYLCTHCMSLNISSTYNV